MYENGQFAKGFTSVAHYRDADYAAFQYAKRGWTCAGFRRLGPPQRGGYESIMRGIICAPPPSGKNLTNQQVDPFVEPVRLK